MKLWLKVGLRSLYFTLMVIALLGPSFGSQRKEVKSEGKDIFLAVDLSQSMDAVDIKPSRIEKVKFELQKVVKAFNSDRIGLVIFTSEAFVQSPLTFDHAHLLNLVSSTLSTTQIANQGTDFAPPLKLTLEKLLDENESKVEKNASKVIVMVSDGEDFGDETIEVANEIKEEGIKLFTLGIGTSSGGKIPDSYRYLRDRSGKEVVSKLNANALKKLADITDGQYFEISDDENETNKLINAIGNIKGEFRDAKKMDVKANKYFIFLLIAFLMMLADVLITVKILRV